MSVGHNVQKINGVYYNCECTGPDLAHRILLGYRGCATCGEPATEHIGTAYLCAVCATPDPLTKRDRQEIIRDRLIHLEEDIADLFARLGEYHDEYGQVPQRCIDRVADLSNTLLDGLRPIDPTYLEWVNERAEAIMAGIF